ncbi:hypothetical protein ACTG16_21665 [Aeromonas sp. 23P]|uniref:hypothetical protein n=1 Tax=Aeromonas sp. 23P TaxID=3452716 RepID=UPI003F78C633
MKMSTDSFVKMVKNIFPLFNNKSHHTKADNRDVISDSDDQLFEESFPQTNSLDVENSNIIDESDNLILDEDIANPHSPKAQRSGTFDDLLFEKIIYQDTSAPTERCHSLNEESPVLPFSNISEECEKVSRILDSLNNLDNQCQKTGGKDEPCHIKNDDAWQKLQEAHIEVPKCFFSHEKSMARRDTFGKNQKNLFLRHSNLDGEIDYLIEILKDIKDASALIPITCQDVLAKEISSISKRLDLSDVSEKNEWDRIDELSSSLIAMELMSARKQVDEAKSSLLRAKKENQEAVNYNNTRRNNVLFSTYGYKNLQSLMDKQTLSIADFIKASPAYDIDYSMLKIRTIPGLVKKFPTVRELALASYRDLISVHGVGDTTITKIKNSFSLLNLPTVFIDDDSMNIPVVFESVMKEEMINTKEFRVPYAICGENGVVYKPSCFGKYTNFILCNRINDTPIL